MVPPNSTSIPSLSHASSSHASLPSSSLVLSDPNTVAQIEQIQNTPLVDHTTNTATHINQPTIDITLSNHAINVQNNHQSTIPPSMIDPFPMPQPEPPISTDPLLHRSTQLRFPYSHTATLDGLVLNPWVAATISDPSPPSPPIATSLAHDNDDGNVLAFLAKFVPYCDTYYLLPLDVPSSDFLSAPEVLVLRWAGITNPHVVFLNNK